MRDNIANLGALLGTWLARVQTPVAHMVPRTSSCVILRAEPGVIPEYLWVLPTPPSPQTNQTKNINSMSNLCSNEYF